MKTKVNIWHIIIGGTIGNLSEWYNFLLYVYLTPIISQLFFPTHNQLLSITLTFTVFAISFFVRPFGGILFGWIGDIYGRQRALVISLIMMAVPTFLIGCLPTYNTFGVASPILLCFFRICQGLSAGGEHTGSAVYVAEYAPPNHRTLWVSSVPASAAIGLLFSSLASLFIVNSFTHEQLFSWGWRTGYWAGTLLCLIGLLLRITLPETPYFQKILNKKNKHLAPVADLLTHTNALKNLALVICLASGYGVFYQMLFIWMPTYLTEVQHFSNAITLQINSYFMIMLICLVLLVGYCADHISRKIILIVSCCAMFIFAYPLFHLLSSGSLNQVRIAMGLFTLIFSLYIPTAFVIMVEAFATQIRYTGLSFGFNIGLALFGGTCPLIATWLIQITGRSTAPAFYLMVLAALVIIGSLYIHDKRGHTI